MKIKWKRLWSSLLVVVMLVSLLPAALAEGTDESTTTVTIYHSMVYDSKTLSSSEDLAKLNVDWNPGDGSFTETVETAVTEDGNIKLPAPQKSVVEYMDSTKRIPVATWTCVGYLSNSDWQSTVEVTNWSNATVSSDYYIMYIWTRTAYPTSKVSYNFGIAEDGEAAKTGQLPAGAVILQLTEGDVQLGTAYTGSSSVIADVVQGLPISNVPATGAFDKVVDFIAYKNSPDEDGKTVRTWYEFQGWQKIKDDSDDSGAEEAIALYSVEEELDADADEELIVGESAMNLVAQWREISAEELASYANEDGAPALGLTKKYTVDGKEYDSKISQHSSSTTWSENGAKTPLELDSNRQVYYKATMEMDSGIAKLLETGGNIQNPEFAGFTINVELDKQLELVTDANGAVTFKFTCTFLKPTDKILDSDKKEIECSTITKGSTTYFTVLANDLPNEFNIPVQWKPGAYEAGTPKQEGTLQEEISLEVAAAKVPGEDEQTVMTTGVITGYIDLTKAGQKESDIVYAILSQDAWVKYYGNANGNISALSALKANEHLKYAIKNLELNANEVYAHVDGPEPEPIVPEWETSKSKTATNLDENYESQVTLSLPSAEEELVTDVVFVLDKSTSATVETEALNMLSTLKTQLENTGAKIKVGVVIFNKEANVANNGEFFDLTTEYKEIETAIQQEISSGTNTHAGLLAGKAMLDNDTSVDASRKYLIFVSDGITYMYNSEPTATAWSFNNPNSKDDWHGSGSWTNWAGPDNWYSKYHTNNPPEDWDVWMETIATQVATQSTQYEYPYGGTATNATATDISNWDTAYAMTIDKALYLTYQTYQDAVKAGYHCYAMTAESDVASQHPWATSFMEYLANGEDISFADIQNDIYYLLGAGSKVVDVIGEGTYNRNQYYDFDFVNSAENLTLTVGEAKYTTAEITDNLAANETARYTFNYKDVKAENGAEAPFVLHYYAKGENGKSDECFVWDINVPVSQFETVQLTYTVCLTNPQTEDGTYGQYDADGSEKYDGLYTNNSAILYPIDSNGNKVQEEEFNKPTVSYKVETVPTGTLHISKYVADNEADPNAEYSFTAQIGDQTETFKLKDGETKTFTDLALGTAYSITETNAKGYNVTYYNEKGEITEESLDAVAAVINVPVDEGALVISKTVNGGSLTKEFTFKVELSAAGTYSYTGSKTGTITSGGTVTLKNGESISINNLPAGTTYTVTETAVDGYTTTISGDDATMNGTIESNAASGTIVKGAAAVAHYTNTYKTPVVPPVPADEYDLTVTKKLSKVNGKSYKSGNVEVGDELTYTITVENTGDFKLSNITVTDELPEDVEFVDATKGYDYNERNDELSWTIRSLNVGDEETYTVTVEVLAGAESSKLTNTVEAECKQAYDKDSVTIKVEEDDTPNVPVRPVTSSKPTLNLEDHVAYIIGYVDGTVQPLNDIKRSEVATIFFRLLTDESRAYWWSQTNDYSDVDADDWFNNAVSTLSNAGIITGYLDGTFRPNEPITRSEFAAIAARFSDVVYNGGNSFSDVPANHWAARYIALAEHLGWITGYPDGTFKPEQNITRAESMTLINRVLERAVEEEHMLPDMVTWVDNVPGTWYYEAVQEATNSHEYVRTGEQAPGHDFNYEDWQEIETVPDWAALEKAWSTANRK